MIVHDLGIFNTLCQYMDAERYRLEYNRIYTHHCVKRFQIYFQKQQLKINEKLEYLIKSKVSGKKKSIGWSKMSNVISKLFKK